MPHIVTPTHIDLIRPGDTVLIDGRLKTVSPGNIKRGFTGTTLWGDSHKLGTAPVQRVTFEVVMKPVDMFAEQFKGDLTMDDFFDSCMREELRAEDRHARRILANHLRHPDPRDPDRIDSEEEVPLDETPIEH